MNPQAEHPRTNETDAALHATVEEERTIVGLEPREVAKTTEGHVVEPNPAWDLDSSEVQLSDNIDVEQPEACRVRESIELEDGSAESLRINYSPRLG